MNVSNCKGCGRLFNQFAREAYCRECAKTLEEKFQKVKEYLREHPKAGMEELSRENEVSVKQLKQWVREERLVFSEDSLVGIDCERCGKMICSGRYCDECKAEMSTTLRSALDKKPNPFAEERKRQTDKNRMRFL